MKKKMLLVSDEKSNRTVRFGKRSGNPEEKSKKKW